MERKYNKMIAAVAALFLITSCSSSYLDTNPTGSYNEDDVFTTTDNAFSAINGIHKSMVDQYEGSQSCGGYPGLFIFWDALGDDLVFPTTGNGWYVSAYKWIDHRRTTATLDYFSYRFFYKLISNANAILEKTDAAVGPEGDKKMIKGQAFAYRGFSHFALIQMFGERYDATKTNDGLGVPLMISTKEIKKPRETVAKVYKQIIEDLDSAIISLSDPKNKFVPDSKTHFTPAIVYGLRARVALTMQDWEGARDFSQKAIKAFKGKLMDQEQYVTGFNDATNPEWMWAFHMIPDQTLYFYGFMSFMSYNFGSSNIKGCQKCISKSLYDQISATDVRAKMWDPTGKMPLPTTAFAKAKYMNRKFKVADGGSSVADAAYMRLAEMYLIQAEAKARLGEADAADVLYTFVSTRDSKYTRSTKTGTDLVNEILVQRRSELWGEGFRFFDLKRLNAPLDRENSNHDESVTGGKLAVPAGDMDWQFVIPQKEIDANNLVKQNPMR